MNKHFCSKLWSYHNIDLEKKSHSSPFWSVNGPYLLNLETPSPKDDLCQVWLKLAQWFWRIRFLNTSMYFRYCVMTSPWKRVWPFIWINLMLIFQPKRICAKFGWNWPSGTWGKDFFIFVIVFSILCNYLPFKKGVAPHLNKLVFPLPKDTFFQVWLKLALWRRFLISLKFIWNDLPRKFRYTRWIN